MLFLAIGGVGGACKPFCAYQPRKAHLHFKGCEFLGRQAARSKIATLPAHILRLARIAAACDILERIALALDPRHDLFNRAAGDKLGQCEIHDQNPQQRGMIRSNRRRI